MLLAPFGIRPKGTLIARMIPLAAELQTMGHVVIIIAPPYTNPEDSGKTEVVRGVTVINISLGPVTGAAVTPFLAHRMFWQARAERPDLVHLFKPKGYGGIAAMVHLMLLRLGASFPPLFVDTDDWEGKGGMNDMHPYSRAERIVFGIQEARLPLRAAGVTVASRALEVMVVAMGIPRQRLLYLPNCVGDPPSGNGTALRKRMGIAPETPVVLLYTRFFEFSQEKLHFLLAEIFRQIPGVRFLVVGKGRLGEEELLLAAGRKMGFAPALVMAGWVEPISLPDHLAAGDLALYPFSNTLVNRTKCPAKLTEILLAERAVIADNVGQLAEYIDPGRSGILCDPDNWEEMANQAVRLLNDPELRRTVGESGGRYLRERFRWFDFAQRLDNLYVECVSAGSERNS